MSTPVLARQQLAFGCALHTLLSADDPTGNLTISPYSVAAALGLVAEGARGRTAEELATLLGPPPAGGEPTPDDGLRIANTFWVDRTVQVRAGFSEAVAARPGGAVRPAPFGTEPETARVAINDDVERTTQGWIRELLPRGAVREDTKAALVNALWARLRWRNPFRREDTESLPFHGPSGAHETPTMQQTHRWSYAEANGWQLVTLESHAPDEADSAPGDLVMDLILPPAGTPAEADPAVLDRLYGTVRDERVDLRLPRFAVAGGGALSDPLSRLGAGTMFTDQADLSGISDTRLKVDQVFHRAVLAADEVGAEGAAATAVMMVMAAGMPTAPPVPMYLDRPFLAVVRHLPTGAPLFLSRVATP